MRLRIVAYTNQQLLDLSGPQDSSQPQCIPWLYYDTQSYTSGTSTALQFYQAVQSDKTMGNIPQAGTLDSPKYYAIESVGFDVLFRPALISSAASTGPLDDIAQLLFSQRGTLTFTFMNKAYGPWPLSAFQASGGPTGFGWGTFTATNMVEYANNGIPNGEGWGMDQQIILRPTAQFVWAAAWAAAITLANGNTNLRHWMYGAQYQAVV